VAALMALKMLHLYDNPLAEPQSSAVEAWLTALEAGRCDVVMINPDGDGRW
jgi:hypothetical protein|tara:strand:- start:595 stop:747 length:153 start_codon:yes stop_codon:yes gene_type:complete